MSNTEIYINPDEDLPEPDFDYDDEDDESLPVFWCSCCNHTCVENPGGWGCPKCGSIMEEYFL
jgi:rubrerythrin